MHAKLPFDGMWLNLNHLSLPYWECGEAFRPLLAKLAELCRACRIPNIAKHGPCARYLFISLSRTYRPGSHFFPVSRTHLPVCCFCPLRPASRRSCRLWCHGMCASVSFLFCFRSFLFLLIEVGPICHGRPSKRPLIRRRGAPPIYREGHAGTRTSVLPYFRPRGWWCLCLAYDTGDSAKTFLFLAFVLGRCLGSSAIPCCGICVLIIQTQRPVFI